MPFRVIRKSFDGSETEVQQGEAATRIALCRCEEMPARNYYVERRNAIEDLERGQRVLSKNCVYWQEQVVMDDIDAIHQQNEKVAKGND